MRSRPVAIDLFAGAGGLSLGFEQAGFDIAAAVEVDPIHAAVHHFNFPNTAVIPRSIVGLSGDSVRAAAKIGKKSVDVVFGGPPCQGFSMIGQRSLDDPRNHLVNEFLRMVVELGAKTFVFENVKGLTVGKHRMFLDSLIRKFEDAGYNVRTPWRVLNAMNYGVPQNRQRLFLLGSKKGLPVADYPAETTPSDPDLLTSNCVYPRPSCFDALADLPDIDRWKELLEVDYVEYCPSKANSTYAQELRSASPESWHFGYMRSWNPNFLTSSMRTVHSPLSKKRFKSTLEGEVEPISRFFKLSRTGVSNTLRAGTDAARGAFTSPRPIHYFYPRCVTVREMARLHGYPDWFRFHSTKWHGARQIGNSVPPPLGRAVAYAVIKSLGLASEKPDLILHRPDENLLYMDMTQAARFWGIPVTIPKRTRKKDAVSLLA
jgi:DNA (cytosine-5)-methyltransferase 1